MTTVPKPGETMSYEAQGGTHITLVGDDGSDSYGRPTAGNNAPLKTNPDGGGGLGQVPTDADAPSAVIPDGSTAYSISSLMGGGADVGTGDTMAGPDMGHGATIVVGDSGDRPSGADHEAMGVPGTVGPSLNQGITQSPTDVRDDFPKGPGLP